MNSDSIYSDYLTTSESPAHQESQDKLICLLSEKRICDTLREGLQERYKKEKAEQFLIKSNTRAVWSTSQFWTSMRNHICFFLFGLSYSMFLWVRLGKNYPLNYAFIPGNFGPSFFMQLGP